MPKEDDGKSKQQKAVDNEMYPRNSSMKFRGLPKANVNIRSELEKTSDNLTKKAANTESQMDRLKALCGKLQQREEHERVKLELKRTDNNIKMLSHTSQRNNELLMKYLKGTTEIIIVSSNKTEREALGQEEKPLKVKKEQKKKPEIRESDTPEKATKLVTFETLFIEKWNEYINDSTHHNNTDMLEKLILKLPVESLRKIEAELMGGIKKLTETLLQLEDSEVRDLFRQSNIVAKMLKMQKLKRSILNAIYTVSPTALQATNNGGQCRQPKKMTSSDLLSEVENLQGSMYFRDTFVIPRLNLDGEVENPSAMKDTKGKRKFGKRARGLLSLLSNIFRGHRQRDENVAKEQKGKRDENVAQKQKGKKDENVAQKQKGKRDENVAQKQKEKRDGNVTKKQKKSFIGRIRSMFTAKP